MIKGLAIEFDCDIFVEGRVGSVQPVKAINNIRIPKLANSK
jgi:hypothetical protein